MKKVIISGGGTGGHIFPAIAIANAIKQIDKDIEILFIGAKGRMEMTKVPAAGFTIEGLNISGFQRRLTWKNLTFPFKLFGSILKANNIISRFKPDVVIGVGGYASGPTLRVATSKKIPAIIQEQNSFPGVTNRLLAAKVQKICVAYEGMEKYFPGDKIIFTGNPIRKDLTLTEGKRDEALTHFGLEKGYKTLLVVGGSLGARTINQALQKFVTEEGAGSDLQVLWQTGSYYYENIRSGFIEIAEFAGGSNITNTGSKIRKLILLPFIDRMDLAYAAADIIVSRAGAIAISELCVVGKPVILIPSPNVSEDHQTKNARALESRNAAIMIPDVEACSRLGEVIMQTVSDDALRATLQKNIASLGITNAAEKIAGAALSLAGWKPGNTVPESIYFLGIGGIGMSALARYFVSTGAQVSGYDKTPTSLTDNLMREGIKIHFTEDISQVPVNPGMVVYTPAIPAEHAELRFFREHNFPMKKRAEILGMIASKFKTIAVAGTHGKTSTSTMIAHMLRVAGVETMAFLGGISKNYETNFLSGKEDKNVNPIPDQPRPGPSCVVEADEYDKSFLHLSPFIAVITSADADHLDIYGNHEDMKRTFAEFTGKIVPGGSLVMKEGTSVEPENKNTYTVYNYSLSPGVTFCGKNIRVNDGLFHFDFVYPGGEMKDLVLGVPGRFNLENSIAALTVCFLLGIRETHLRSAVLSYQGVRRRFDIRIQQPDLVYIDDYAHHPEELKACINAVRELFPGKRITGVFQPHLFSRTRDLADDFARSLALVDELILMDIYPAREKPIAGITSMLLLDKVNLAQKRLAGKEELLRVIRECKPQVLLTMGAGDIDQFVEPISQMLSE